MVATRKVEKLPVRYNGRAIAQITISGETFTRGMIINEVNNLAKAGSNGIEYCINLPYPGGWRSGGWFTVEQGPTLFTLLNYYDEDDIGEDPDPERYNTFIVYARRRPEMTGGCRKGSSPNNDCLFECLRRIYGSTRKLPKIIKNGAALKDALGLQRKDCVPLSLIPRLEKILENITINVTGDASIESSKKCDRIANLILTNGHFSVAKSQRPELKGWCFESKKPLVYKTDGINGVVHFYDGISHWTGTYQELYDIRCTPRSGDWCLVPSRRNHSETLEETYTRFNQEANELLKKTNNVIDLRKAGAYKPITLKYFRTKSQGIRPNGPLSPSEAQWISDTMMGGLIWGELWEGEAEQYDVTSMYPSLMIKPGVTWPIDAGEFCTVSNAWLDNQTGKKYYKYGLYRASISGSPLHSKKLFRFNPRGIYTHYDLTHAEAMGFQVVLKRCSPNALIYSRLQRISGSVMFEPFVDELFQIKCQGGPAGDAAKKILNMLWGALSERKLTSTVIGKGTKYNEESPFELPEGEMLQSIMPIGTGNHAIKTTNPGNLFVGEYPRIAPFLLAFGRMTIFQLIRPYSDHLKRIHTDGFIVEGTNVIPTSANAKKELGALKLEKKGTCQVKNAIQVLWKNCSH